MKRKILLILIIFSIIILPISGHPGRTDSNGGHYCRTNCEKWGLKNGEYHYHNSGSTASPTSTSTVSPTASQTVSQTSITNSDRYVNTTSIVDGDTIYIDYKEKVRFVGINTPEIGNPGSLEAKSYVENRIMGKQIYLDVDDKNTKDKYGRTLAVIMIDGDNLNKELLCKGYAEVMYIPPSEFDPNSWLSSCPNTSVMIRNTPTTIPTVIETSTGEVKKSKDIETLPMQTPKASGFESFMTTLIVLVIYLFRKN